MATTSTSMPYTGIIIIALVLSSSGTNGDHDGSLKNDFSKESGGGGTSTKMKIAVDINVGCGFSTCKSNRTTLANLTTPESEGDDPTLPPLRHQWVWAVAGRPTMQASLSTNQENLQVDWSRLLGSGDVGNSVEYSTMPEYSVAVMLSSLVECAVDDEDRDEEEEESSPDVLKTEKYANRIPSLLSSENDVNDSPSTCIWYPLDRLSWRRTAAAAALEGEAGRVAFAFVGENFTAPNTSPDGSDRPIGIMTAGKLNITFSAYSGYGFGAWLPHLSHTESTNQFDIQLEGIETRSGFNQSRFSLEFYLAAFSPTAASDDDSGSANSSSMEPYEQSTKILDDEHTPGIFETHELVIPGFNSSLKSYLQWRPVVYATRDRDIASSTSVYVSHSSLNGGNVLEGTMLYAMYGRGLEEKGGGMIVRKVTAELGKKGDAGYGKTNYQAWTFTLGTGSPLRDGVSPFVLLAFTALLGSSSLVSATAIVLFLARRLREKARRKMKEEERMVAAGGPYARLIQES